MSVDDTKPVLSDAWKCNFPNPFADADAALRFKEGVTGYARCLAVADALVEGGFPMPERSDQRAQAVAWLLVEVAREL